jgi:DNA-binding beta-propeller fold protein YncE
MRWLPFTCLALYTPFASGIVIALSSWATPAMAQNLFVANMNEDTIYEFAPDGSRSVLAVGLNGPQGLVFDGNGNLFVANEGADTILEFTPERDTIHFRQPLWRFFGLQQ